MLSALVQGLRTNYSNEYKAYLACMAIIGCVTYIGGPNGAHITTMFELGLADVLLHALSMEENEICVSKAIYIC